MHQSQFLNTHQKQLQELQSYGLHLLLVLPTLLEHLTHSALQMRLHLVEYLLSLLKLASHSV
jgi:hypothetical protein